MYTMIRTFHPVGQGLFCTERFFREEGTSINVVYDCGSLSLCSWSQDVENSKLKDVLDESFNQGEEIEAIFVSHYDLDHINGIRYLVKNHKVKKIFLPEFTKEDYALVYALQNFEDGAYDDFSLRLMRAYRGERDLFRSEWGFDDVFVPVSFESTDIRNSDRINGVQHHLQGLEDAVSNVLGIGEFSKWLFVPFNNYRKDRPRKIREVLARILGDINKCEYQHDSPEVTAFIDSPEIYIRKALETTGKDILKEINKILKKKLGHEGDKDFKSAYGSLNGSSMTLYSGECHGDCHEYGWISYCGEWKSSFSCCHTSSPRMSTGCLYCGDYEAKDNWSELKTFYCNKKSCWAFIGCIQLPHHGSKHNFNDDIINLHACAVACYGIGNRYGHPGLEVVEKLRNDGSFFYHVTEHSKCVGVLRCRSRRGRLSKFPRVLRNCVLCVCRRLWPFDWRL